MRQKAGCGKAVELAFTEVFTDAHIDKVGFAKEIVRILEQTRDQKRRPDARCTLYGSQNEGFRPPSPDTPNPASEPSEQTSSFAGTSETRPARFELATSRSGGD